MMKGSFTYVKILYIVCCFTVTVFYANADISETKNETEEYLKFEKQAVTFLKNARKQIMSFMYDAVAKYSISGPCLKTMMKYYNDFLLLKSWTLKLVDSLGKPPGGVLRGTMTLLGDYDQCLSITEPINVSKNETNYIFGKYCMTFIKIPRTMVDYLRTFTSKRAKKGEKGGLDDLLKILQLYGSKLDEVEIQFRVGICIPSTCTAQDLRNTLNYSLSSLRMNPEIRSCETNQDFVLETHQIVILVIFGAQVTLVILSTIFDIYVSQKIKYNKRKQNVIKKLVLWFSIRKNAKELFSESIREEEYMGLPPLRGLFVLLLCFFIFVTSYTFIDEQYMRNLRSNSEYFEFLKDPLFAIVVNSTILVQAVFCIAGFILFYKLPSMIDLSSLSVMKMIATVLLRCHIPFLIATGCFLLLPAIGRGPAWHEVLDKPLQACRRNWWPNLLLVNNFWKVEKQCLLHTWVLGCLSQVVAVGLIFKELINRWPRFGIATLILTGIFCNVAADIITVYDSLPPTISGYFVFGAKALETAMEKMYLLPYPYFLSFSIGMITGYWMQSYPLFRFRKVTYILLWIGAIIVSCLLIYGLYPFHNGVDMDFVSATFYTSLNRPVFAIITAYCLVACINGYGGCLNQILSSRHFILPWKLSYMAYLLHWIVIYFRISIARERTYYSHYEMIFRSLGHILASFSIACILQVLFNGWFTLDQLLMSDGKNLKRKEMLAWNHIRGFFCQEKYKIRGNAEQISVETSLESSIASVNTTQKKETRLT